MPADRTCRRVRSAALTAATIAVIAALPAAAAPVTDARVGSLAPRAAYLPATLESWDEEPASAESSGQAGLNASLWHETPAGDARALPLPSEGPEAIVRVHRYGSVQAFGAERMLWDRPARSFVEEWGIDTPKSPVVSLPDARTRYPVNPFQSWINNPFIASQENLLAVGDVNADGTDDVAVAHYPSFYEGETWTAGAFVTVLDGGDGGTLWWRRYPLRVFASQIVFADMATTPGMELAVASEPPEGSSTIQAFDFVQEGGALREEPLWTWAASGDHAAFFHMALVSADPPRLAASTGTVGFGAAGQHGDLVVLDARTGSPAWMRPTDGWVRLFRPDPAREALVAVELDDYVDAETKLAHYAYTVRALALADGAELASARREGAVPAAFEIGNGDADPALEWAVSEFVTTDGSCRMGDGLGFCHVQPLWVLTRVVLMEPDGSVAWTYASQGEWTALATNDRKEYPFGLTFVSEPPRVLVTAHLARSDAVYAYPVGAEEDLAGAGWSDTIFALEAGVGGVADVAWRVDDAGIHPTSVLRTTIGGRQAILAGSDLYGGRAFDAATGASLATLPVLAQPTAGAVAEIDGDGTRDLVIGGGSAVLFALDGETLGDSIPANLWWTPLEGPIHEVELGDVTGDGTPEVVVAADTEVAAIRLSDGHVLWSVDPQRLDERFLNVTLVDLDGKGGQDVVVASDRLLALDGVTGQQLWQYRAADPIRRSFFAEPALMDSDADGQVDLATAYFPRNRTGLTSRHLLQIALVDGSGGAALWERNVVVPQLDVPIWKSVVSVGTAAAPRVAVSFVWRGDTTSVAARPRTLVYDARDGTLLWTATVGQEDGYRATLASPHGPDELFVVTPHGVWRGTPGGSTGIDTGLELFDATFAELAAGETHLLVAKGDGVQALADEVVRGAGGPIPSGVPSWNFPAGARSLQVVELDGDQTDEVLALEFDIEAFTFIRSGVGTPFGGSHPEGYAVLELSS